MARHAQQLQHSRPAPITRPPPRERDLERRAPLRSVLVLSVVVLVLLAGWLDSSGRWPFLADPGPPPSLTALPPGAGKPLVAVGSGSALALLETLAVKGKAPGNDYQRSAFGDAWADVDGNGCDTRNDVLRRDLSEVTLAPGSACLVTAGSLAEPYTGHDVVFKRGKESSGAVQIDHVVALGNAWRTGAANLEPQQRQSLANDPLNLLAADGPANEDKSDADAATWLPPSKKFRCHYVARQISVKAAYRLWVTPAEKAAMQRVLGLCPQQQSLPSGYLPQGG